jgi:L-threonylcarbamoyladenylate synthase
MDFETDIKSCVETLHKRGIILYPTDTIWGIGCDATLSDAVDRVLQLKKRSDKDGLIVLIPDARDLLKYVSHPHPGIFDFLQSTKKPTTVIYDGMIGLADNLSADGSIAIRVVQDPFCKQLIKRFRKPIVSTSANISGQPPPKFFHEISSAIKDGVDFVVHHRQNDTTVHEPSSIVKFLTDGSVNVIRP